MANSKVIPTAAVIVLGVGSVNSIAKNKRLPSTRFLIGTGVVFLVLAALSEADEQVANALAVAVAVTVVLGDGDGVFSYVNKHGEADTKAPSHTPKNKPGEHKVQQGSVSKLDATNIYDLPKLTPIPNIG